MSEASGFGARMRRLRGERGLSLAQLSGLTHYSKGYLSNVENGRKPATTDLAKRLDEVLGAEGVLVALAIQARDTEPCPYRGLAAFGPADAPWFFGRQRAIDDLVKRLAESLTGELPLVMLGASGAGKSSLLAAGLLPALARGVLPVPDSATWPVLAITPATHPTTVLAEETATLLGVPAEDLRDGIDSASFGSAVRTALGPDDRRLLVIVDQFEEVFTLCESEEQRQRFIGALFAAARPGAHGEQAAALVVLGVRADFYRSCLAYPELLRAVQDNQFALGAMDRAELVEAITAPARAAKLAVEPGLVELLLRDLGMAIGSGREAAGYEPGVLPLLSHALLATWQERENGTLTVVGYQRTGGVYGAVAATAERVYNRLDPAAQQAARRVLLRLVRVGENGEDTRRRVDRDRLVGDTAQHEPVMIALEALVSARLLTLDRTSVEITHEALLRAWPRLSDWIDADRTGLHTHQRLVEAAEAWDRQGRQAGLTYRGAALAGAREWREAHEDELTPVERDFLHGSAREERKGIRRLRKLVAALTVSVVLTTVVGGMALVQRQNAITERDVATSRQAAERASGLLDTDPSLAGQLAVAAYRMADTPAARGAMLSSLSLPYPTRLYGGGDQIDAVALRGDGTLTATGGIDGVLQLWDNAEGRSTRPVATLTDTGKVTALDFSPDGRTLAVSAAGGVRLWDVGTPEQPTLRAVVAPDVPTSQVRFSSDGTLLATTGSADHDVRLWDVRVPAQPAPLAVLADRGGEATKIAFSPAGPAMVTTGERGTVLLWDVRDPRNPPPPQVIGDAAGEVSALAFSQDGRTLAVADEGNHLWLSAVAGPRAGGLTAFSSPNGLVRGLAFTKDATHLAVGASDGIIRIMDVGARREVSRLAQPNRVRAMAADRSGAVFASSSSAGRAYLWHLPPVNPSGHDTELQGISVDPGTGIIATTARRDQRVRLWRTTDWNRLTSLATLTGHTDAVLGTAFSPRRAHFATAGADRVVRLWDITAPDRPDSLAVLDGYHDAVSAVAWSPDGNTLATGDDEGVLAVWDVTDPRRPVRLATLTEKFRNVNAVAFSPDGRYLASGNTDRTIRLWDMADRARPSRLATVAGFREAVTSVEFSSDGRLLAGSGLDQTARVWDLADPRQPAALATITGHTGPVGTVHFSPDNHTLTTTSADRSTRLWNMGNPRQPELIAALRVPDADVTRMVFTATGGRIAIASNERVMRLWDAGLDTAVRRICAWAGTPITRDEWSAQFGDYPYQPPCP
ncbi:helix-turn-helix domain-containing protein [Amycolatopsis sp. NPDC059021]|uniref:nSTAND1 domain-containing NTPase n=1 Tax=Amycolatopsis sp. NPDC059021 TaxID=3346704 RepID=UPI00366C3973